ncbi:MAG TPA: hypothetical protein VN918_10045 [Myxococcaceae bacterium]|nr:hypothetical protein [Myxococcaceae bacterium]
MAQTSSPPAHKLPTLQTAASAKRAPIESAPDTPPPAEVAPPGWPAGLQPLPIAIDIVTGRREPPSPLRAGTETLLSSLSFAERAALHQPHPSEDGEALRAIVATRWRLMGALTLRPSVESVPDPAAFEELLREVDEQLAGIGKLTQSDDPDVREACERARNALAKDVQKLLPTSSGPSSTGASATDDLKQLRKALAAAATTDGKSGKGFSSVTQSKKAMVVLAASIVSMAMGAFTIVKALHEELPPPVPALPAPPPNTELIGNPESGTVIVRSTNGQPIDEEALRSFKTRAASSGANVQTIGPTQALVTSARAP